MKTKLYLSWFVTIIVFQISCYSLFAQTDTVKTSYENIYEKIESLYDEADIPGLTFILVDEKNTYIKTWGYSDLEHKIPVNSKTLFELGSTSKAFTALAILKMEKEGLIKLDDNTSKYIPWFKVFYEGNEVQISIKELLHHTSGIPTEIISKIPQGESDDMLEKTVHVINDLKLKRSPGKEYEYSTINYDILGLIIEKISHLSFEEYLQKNIFQALELEYTSVGTAVNDNDAKGYKISFFSPREYQAPRYRGNNPAGYVISNGDDMAKWLKYQLSIDSNCLEGIIKKSHIPDLTVIPNGLSSYASGWMVEPYGEAKISHGGLNPNFTSFVGFLPDKKLGIAILANSNSSYTSYFGNVILDMLNKEDVSEIPMPENSMDKVFSLISLILMVFIGGVFILFVWVIKGIITGERKFKTIGLKSVLKLFLGLLLTTPFIFGIYLIPKALMGFSWEAAIVWAPNSFLIGCILFVSAVFGIWILSAISTLIPTKNQYYRSLPMIVVLSIMSGLANMTIILLLINAIGSEAKVTYLLYYFILVLIFYISSRKTVQTKLINISLSIVYELRMKLINKIFLSSFQKFEKIDNGRVYATLNQDTATISNSVNILISLISNTITIVGVFVYLGTISLIATVFILIVIACVAVLYFIVSKKTRILFEQARDTANIFSGLIDGLLYGFKELSLSGLKKNEYTKEVDVSCLELRNKSGLALVKFVNAFLIGETLLIMVLGTVSFLIPFLFPEIPNYKLLGFIMIVLYLIGPINGVLSSIPNIMQIKVSWKRIKFFINDINPDLKLMDILKVKNKEIDIKSLSAKGLIFEYKNGNEDNSFKVGPINLNINSGEILFVIGGNGSGKSTLANLLTGLYIADEGFIEVNGKKINSNELGGLYSTIFSNHHIFKKLYGIDTDNKKEELDYLLKLLRLEEKVSIDNGSFSTIDLSNGQRKRLSLMKCFLEDSQIYLFDEWAADQDPEYKKIFYRELLPKMKKQGKIVIAITHDDNYFDVADRIIKMDMGKLVKYQEIESVNEVVVKM
jgi:cyclic peptide transporter